MPEVEIHVISLFPEMLAGFTQESIIKRAQEKGIISITCVNPRNFTKDKHRTCDDTPYGGGAGMILKPEPIFEAVESIKRENSHTILLSPRGRMFSQQKAGDLAKHKHIIMICGNYEGIDERVNLGLVDEEISIGDYILSNGTLAAAVVIDSLTRIIPGVLGNEESHQDESFSNRILEHPQYTRPPAYRNMDVPEILLSGDHKKIEAWRRQQAINKTRVNRPDLLRDTEQ